MMNFIVFQLHAMYDSPEEMQRECCPYVAQVKQWQQAGESLQTIIDFLAVPQGTSEKTKAALTVAAQLHQTEQPDAEIPQVLRDFLFNLSLEVSVTMIQNPILYKLAANKNEQAVADAKLTHAQSFALSCWALWTEITDGKLTFSEQKGRFRPWLAHHGLYGAVDEFDASIAKHQAQKKFQRYMRRAALFVNFSMLLACSYVMYQFMFHQPKVLIHYLRQYHEP